MSTPSYKRVFGALAGAAIWSNPIPRLTLALVSAVGLALLPAAPMASTPVQIRPNLVASGPWLDRFNAWRASTGTSALTEDTTYSAGDVLHATYMVQTGQVTHFESTAYPQYTAAGDLAAQNSNIFVSSSTATSDTQSIDWWMGAPFHAMAMMDPRLTTTGFGSYRQSPSPSTWQMGAAVNVGQGMTAPGQYPVFFPGNGSTEPLTAYSGNEFPDPTGSTGCPGYSGLPLFIEVGGNVNTSASAHAVTQNGTLLDTCAIDSTNATYSSYLKWRGGVIVMPRSPLQSGLTYVVAVTVNLVPYTWSFTVGPSLTPASLVSVIGVSPNAGPAAGGTSVTLTGTHFTGATAVAFGTTAAASFNVVNDTTITAVTAAHTVSTVDVTVTTPAGTNAITPLDQFTFTGMASYFQWFDMASPGMSNDNIHLLNTSGSTANITVTLPGASGINVSLAAGAATHVSFGAGHVGGPVVVNSDQQVLASQRVQYYQTFNELWAENATQAATTGFINWYDKASAGMYNDNIHLLNPGTASATVTVSLPGATSQVATVAAGAETYVTFPAGSIGGPVKVSATSPVLASQRVQYYASFNEVWAETAGQASTTSFVNWYDNASQGMLNDHIHLVNPGSTSATVTVSLPGAPSQMATVAAGAEAYVAFPAGTIGGPVSISATQPVLASQRVQYYSTFNEVLAAAATQASTTSHLTWYDKASPGMINDNIHLLNPGGTSASVTVSLPGVSAQVVTVAAGAEAYVAFPAGTIGGPVTVSSTQPVLASQRVQYYSSFNEIWAG